MFSLIAQDGSLGTFKAPSAAFAPEVDASGAAAATTIDQLLSIALGAVTLVAAIYFLFVFVVAAMTWLNAGGDSGKITKARDSMTQGLIGLLIVVASYAIIGVVGSLFGINILNFSGEIVKLAPGIVEQDSATPDSTGDPRFGPDGVFQDQSPFD